MKNLFKHHQKQIKKQNKKYPQQIKKQNKKYPLMEYFLSNKPLEECSAECQRQVKELNKEGKNDG